MRDVQVFIQARLSSTRLPGKALMDLDGDSMTRFMLKRLDQFSPVVLCPDEDVPILSRELNPWPVMGGSKEDVLSRFQKAARMSPARYYVRLTGDCPLVDPESITWVLTCAMAGNHPYYGVTNAPDGDDVEVIRADVLARLKGPDEHVTSALNQFRTPSDEALAMPKYSVDTQEDLDRVRRVVGALGRDCTRDQILAYLKDNP